MSTGGLSGIGIPMQSPQNLDIVQPFQHATFKEEYKVILNEGCSFYNSNVQKNVNEKVQKDLTNASIDKVFLEKIAESLDRSVVNVMKDISVFIQKEAIARENAKGAKIPGAKNSEFWDSKVPKSFTLQPSVGDEQGVKDLANFYDKTLKFLDACYLEKTARTYSSVDSINKTFRNSMPESFTVLFDDTRKKVVGALFKIIEQEKVILFTSANAKAKVEPVKITRSGINLTPEQEKLVNMITCRVLGRTSAMLALENK